MPEDLDLTYRPTTYFRPQKLEQYLLSKVKGAVIRKRLNELFAAGRHTEVRDLLTSKGISAADRKALESFHPMFMGGNYLPDTEQGEVEIARISIKSTTYDVTCVYAKPDDGKISYRVVDEYGGDTLQGPSEATTDLPMTLGEFADFFLKAWPLMDVLESNFDSDREAALGFFSAESEFYPDFDQLCRQRVMEHFPEPEPEWDSGDRCPFCDHFNSPPADDTCEHICANVWDGQVELLGEGKLLEAPFRELEDVVQSADEDSVTALILEAEAGRKPARAQLIEAASGQSSLEEVLNGLADVGVGSGWSTDGMVGGSGYNIYVARLDELNDLAAQCQAIVAACRVKIKTSVDGRATLEGRRPEGQVDWHLVASGVWDEDMHHSGHIAYYIANTGPGEWLLEGVERNAELDDVTQEDIDEGRLNDDQLQAMWSKSLEEAQSEEYRQIVAACSGASVEADAEEMAAVLYRAVCLDGGKEITEPDSGDALLDL